MSSVQPSSPSPSSPPSAAVVGAGLSGLTTAARLLEAGWAVTVFDKSRGSGGRLSTRRVVLDGEDDPGADAGADAGTERRIRFDHGAQYFTARHGSFRERVQAWAATGVARLWEGRVRVLEAGEVRDTRTETERWVGVPGMSSLTRHLAEELAEAGGERFRLVLATRVGRLERLDDGPPWRLESVDGDDLGRFDAVAVTAPAAQTAELLATEPRAADLVERVAGVTMDPCWAVMVAWAQPLEVPFDGAFVNAPEDDDASTDHAPTTLSWIARDGSKPERGAGDLDTWVLHASPAWSREHLERPGREVAVRLLEALFEALGGRDLPGDPVHLVAHRWRYALPREALEERCLVVDGGRLGVGGDWCGGPRVEGAFLSGRALGETLAGGRAGVDTVDAQGKGAPVDGGRGDG